MFVLQIEHAVPSFEGWKQAFDSDPVGRRTSAVRRHQIFRPVDNPNYAIIELDFDTFEEAEAMVAKLKKLWSSVEGSVMTNPQVRIVEKVDTFDY